MHFKVNILTFVGLLGFFVCFFLDWFGFGRLLVDFFLLFLGFVCLIFLPVYLDVKFAVIQLCKFRHLPCGYGQLPACSMERAFTFGTVVFSYYLK